MGTVVIFCAIELHDQHLATALVYPQNFRNKALMNKVSNLQSVVGKILRSCTCTTDDQWELQFCQQLRQDFPIQRSEKMQLELRS